MSHPLDGARLKIERAKEHLTSLRAEVDEYIATKPFKLTVDSRNVFDVILTTPPPPRLSLIVGDVLTNARAALDYVAWELARKYYRYPPLVQAKENDRKKVSFPISENTGNQKKIREFRKRGISQAVINEIKVVQPSNAQYKSLARLHTLVNIDKHQTLTLAYSTYSSITDKSEDNVYANSYVAFTEDTTETVDETLDEVVRTVEHVVSRFDTFFV